MKEREKYKGGKGGSKWTRGEKGCPGPTRGQRRRITDVRSQSWTYNFKQHQKKHRIHTTETEDEGKNSRLSSKLLTLINFPLNFSRPL